MRKVIHSTLGLAIAIACVAAPAQSVRSSPDVFPIAPAPMLLPVAPAPQAPAPVEVRPVPLAPPAPTPEWRIELADGSLSRALRRWSREAKYPILWEAPKDLPAVAATYRSEFLQALTSVMEDSQNSEYPLHACAYDNVVRVLHVTQSCTR
jgi:hypothetical protein